MKVRPDGKNYDSLYEYLRDYTSWYIAVYKNKTTDMSRLMFHVAGALQQWSKDRGEFQ